jgi:hypothetical protein
MTRTTSNAARSNEHEEHPSPREQEIHDQFSQEQFDEEVGNGVAFMLTQEESGEEQGGEAGRGETDEGSSKDDDSTSDMKVLRIHTHVNLDGSQRRMSWTRTLTQTRR